MGKIEENDERKRVGDTYRDERFETEAEREGEEKRKCLFLPEDGTEGRGM